MGSVVRVHSAAPKIKELTYLSPRFLLAFAEKCSSIERRLRMRAERCRESPSTPAWVEHRSPRVGIFSRLGPPLNDERMSMDNPPMPGVEHCKRARLNTRAETPIHRLESGECGDLTRCGRRSVSGLCRRGLRGSPTWTSGWRWELEHSVRIWTVAMGGIGSI